MTGTQLALIEQLREIDEQLFDLAARRRALAVELRESAADGRPGRTAGRTFAPPPATPIAEEIPA